LIIASLVMALAPSLTVASAASFMIGFCCGLSQHAIPLAAELAQPDERGRVVGTVLSGVFTGLLYARVISGLIAERFSWRWSYIVGAAVVALVACAALFVIPN